MRLLPSHPFHIVTPSPWPFLISIAAMVLAIGATLYMHRYVGGLGVLALGLLNVLIIMCLWWRDVIREATFEGMHTEKVQTGLRIGFVLFIVSEVMFFFGFFWAFFYCSLDPSIAIGCVWPPAAITPFDAFGTPLVNTIILLASGVSLTSAHHNLVAGEFYKTWVNFLQTLVLAFAFTGLQVKEYLYAPFAISDGIYGSVFYMITELHGAHVIVGTIFICVNLARFLSLHFTKEHHLGFEFGAWYWHFVDAVWLFVYVFVYWWGGMRVAG